ncbi:MAG: hypothetical protein PHI59_02120 [Candidatus Omnitrophica bacterium]|nr:hypothetical protein [Candidatus Omnitrophota bacterium]
MMFITFIPWLLFWLLLILHKAEPAAVMGCIASLAIVITNSVKGKSIKPMQVMTLLFFIVLSVRAIFSDLEQHWLWMRIANMLYLALIALISILLKQPFTLQYAREQVPKKMWQDPEFIKTNYIVSWAWFFVFIACLIIPVSRLFGFNPPRALGSAFSIVSVLAVSKFSEWYAKRRKVK